MNAGLSCGQDLGRLFKVIRMWLQLWMVLLSLHILVKGVSCADNCGKIRNILAFTGEPYTLDLYHEEVKENTLIDESGNDIGIIKKGERLRILDTRYNDNLTSKGFSFQIKHATTVGQWKFTASVLYTDETHCTQDYHVTVRDDQICSEIKKISYTPAESYFTLDVDSHGVEEISWVDGGGWTIAITQHRAKLQIISSDYEGSSSVIDVSLCIHHENIKDPGNYTARVSFRNGTQCLQRYFVTAQSYPWYSIFMLDTNAQILTVLIGLMIIYAVFWVRKKLNDRLKKKKEQNKQMQSETEKVSYNQLKQQDSQDNVPSQTS